LEQANSTRLAHLVPIRFGYMSLSPFAFYRGTADIMAHDLAKTPVSGILAQFCGDAHLSNFGVYASPERRQVVDVNDINETQAGQCCWSARASKRTCIETFPKLAEVVDGQYRIKDGPPLIYHYDELHPGKDDLDSDEWGAMGNLI
jgi:hypothetical protein